MTSLSPKISSFKKNPKKHPNSKLKRTETVDNKYLLTMNLVLRARQVLIPPQSLFYNIAAQYCFSVLTLRTSFIFLASGNQKIKCFPLVKRKQIYHNCLHLNLRPQESYPGILFRSKKQHLPDN